MSSKKILLSLSFLTLTVMIYAAYLYFKPVQSLKRLDSTFSVSAVELVNDYESNEIDANEKYLNKIIEVKGSIDDIEINEMGINIKLDAQNDISSVVFEMEKKSVISELHIGDIVVIKGICTGYLMDVVLVQGIILDTNN
jgi:hypothetical protein